MTGAGAAHSFSEPPRRHAWREAAPEDVSRWQACTKRPAPTKQPRRAPRKEAGMPAQDAPSRIVRWCESCGSRARGPRRGPGRRPGHGTSTSWRGRLFPDRCSLERALSHGPRTASTVHRSANYAGSRPPTPDPRLRSPTPLRFTDPPPQSPDLRRPRPSALARSPALRRRSMLATHPLHADRSGPSGVRAVPTPGQGPRASAPSPPQVRALGHPRRPDPRSGPSGIRAVPTPGQGPRAFPPSRDSSAPPALPALPTSAQDPRPPRTRHVQPQALARRRPPQPRDQVVER